MVSEREQRLLRRAERKRALEEEGTQSAETSERIIQADEEARSGEGDGKSDETPSSEDFSNDDLHGFLSSIYYDPASPYAFGTLATLMKGIRAKGKVSPLAAEIPRSFVRSWLENQKTYGQHKRARVRFKLPKILSGGPRFLDEADLIDMQKIARQNDGARFILLCIDTFTKMIYVRPLKQKTGKLVAAALQDIWLNEAAFGGPAHFRTDLGTEFYNPECDMLYDWLKIFKWAAVGRSKAA